MRAELPLYLFAKAPSLPGVKTRMQPALDAAARAELARQMLATSAAKAARFWPGACILCVAGDDAFCTDLAAQHGMSITQQIDGDLGARMQSALQSGIETAGAAAVFGADVPHVSGEILAACHETLAAGNNVVGPALDGGFYLLGLQCMPAGLFDGIAWGGGNVLQHLLRRARALNLSLQQIDALRDIDDFADLQYLAKIDSDYARFVA